MCCRVNALFRHMQKMLKISMFKISSRTGIVLLALIVGRVLILASSGVYAAEKCLENSPVPSAGCEIINPLSVNDIPGLICVFISFLTKMLMPPIMVLMVLWASFLLLTSVGQPAKMVQARAMLLYAIKENSPTK